MSFDPHPDDLTETLKQFRTELIETRNLTIKTDNLIKNLSADVRQIGKRQELGDKRWVFNSVMAYVLFSVLIFAGLYLAFQAQVGRERDAVIAHQIRIQDLQVRGAEIEAELERRREAEEEAYSLYRLIEEEKEDEILERFPTIRGKLVNRAETEMMQREVDRINKKLARSAFETGVVRHKRRDFNGARDAFLKSLVHVEKAYYAPELEYKLGMSLFFLKDLDGGVEHLRKALAFAQKKDVRNETLYHLAVALDRLGRGAEARAAYAAYVKRFATDKRSLDAQKRIMHFTREGVEADSGLVIGP